MRNPATPQLRTELAAALRIVDDYLADLVARDDTDVSEFDAPYLHDYRIYRVQVMTMHGAVVHHVAYAPGAAVYILDGEPDEFVDLARADRVIIASAELAVAYAAAYLEFARSPRELFYVLRSIDDVQFVPQPTAAELRAQSRFQQRYSDTIAPPAAESTPTGYRVVLFAMRQRVLERHILQIRQDGVVSDRLEILEKQAPVVYGA